MSPFQRFVMCWGGACLVVSGCGGDDVTTPTTGGLEITTVTTGTEMDADGYAVSIDGGGEAAIASNASLQLNDLATGQHNILLSGVAENCSVSGSNPRTVDVVAQPISSVEFAIVCVATTGGLQIAATTIGTALDPDGYAVTLDGAERGPVASNGTTELEGLTAGSHSVGLSGVAANCAVQGDNPRSATVQRGMSATVPFSITCADVPPAAGTLRIITTTTGVDPDADGYTFALDAGASQPIGVSATADVANVTSGSHSVRLSNLAANCAIQGANPRRVSVSAGATLEVRFAVACGPSTGSLKITSTTTGDSPDLDGYMVAVDNSAAQPIGTSAAVTVQALTPGSHQISLTGLSSKCQVKGENPRSITVTAGTTAETTFEIACISFSDLRAVFTRDPYGGPEPVYLLSADGTTRRLTSVGDLTDYLAYFDEIDWSPDGRRIAISGKHGTGGSSRRDVFLINADGSGTTQLTANLVGDEATNCPDWSPDGNKIAFNGVGAGESQSLRQDIYVINSDGTGLINLTNDPGDETCPIWSPDGSKIAFFFWEPDPNGAFFSDIYVMNPDGSSRVNLTPTTVPVADYGLEWSPDGRQILYTVENSSAINFTNVDGSGERSVTTLSGRGVNSPKWSPDSKQIAFESCATFSCQLYLMTADGTSLKKLTNTQREVAREYPLGWSSDGTKILFYSDTAFISDRAVWSMNADGTGRTRLLEFPSGNGVSFWWH